MATCYNLAGWLTIPDVNIEPFVWLTKTEVDFVLDNWLIVPSNQRGQAFSCYLPHFLHVYDGVTEPARILRLDARGALQIGVEYNQPPPGQ